MGKIMTHSTWKPNLRRHALGGCILFLGFSTFMRVEADDAPKPVADQITAKAPVSATAAPAALPSTPTGASSEAPWMTVIEAYPAIKPNLGRAGYHASVNDDIIVVALNFSTWLDKLIDEGQLAAPTDPAGKRRTLTEGEVKAYGQRVCLFLNEKPFPDLIAERADPSTNFENSGKYVHNNQQDFYLFRFKLRKTAQNENAWRGLLRGQGIKDLPVDVTVGFYNFDGRTSQPHMDSASNPTGDEASQQPQELFSLRTATSGKLWAGVAGMLVILALCFYLGHTTNMLRDTTCLLNPTGRYPFSLGYCQMAFWLLVVSGSFIFIAIVIEEYETISPAAVTLMGIAAATGLSAALINENLPKPAQDLVENANRPKTKKAVLARLKASTDHLQKTQGLITQNQRATDQAAEGPEKIRLQGVMADLQAEISADEKDIANNNETLKHFGFWPALKSFVMDLLQESDTVSFHRFQLMVWTGILGSVFLYNVVNQLAMPDFSASLLILVGISSGTYIGFKVPTSKPAGGA
jgi:hypothetical protein